MSIGISVFDGKDTKNILLYDLDTDESFENRLASTFGIIKEWIAPPINLRSTKTNIQFNSLKQDVLSYLSSIEYNLGACSIKKFFDLYHIREKEYRYPLEKIVLYLLSELLKQNKINDPRILDAISLGIWIEIEDLEYISIQKEYITEFIMSSSKEYTKLLDVEIQHTQTVSNNFTENVVKKIEQTVASSQPFPFQISDFQLYLITNVDRKNTSLDTIFANLSCNEYVPIFSYKHIYKVYDHLPPLSSTQIEIWRQYSRPDIIYGYLYARDKDLYNVQHTGHLDDTHYTPVELSFNEEGLLVIRITIEKGTMEKMEKMNQRIELMLQRFTISCHNIYNINQFRITAEKKTDFSGMVIFPKISFNTVLMSDMMMNDTVFSHFFSVKEFENPSKTLSYGLYLQYFIKGAQGICDLKSKTREMIDQDLRIISKTDLKEGEKFVRLLIKKAASEEVYTTIIMIVSKLLSIYTQNEQRYLHIYQQYSCNISGDDEDGSDGDGDDRQKHTLKDYDPRFGMVVDYTRKCQQRPRVVNDPDEYDEIPDNQKMIFSKVGDDEGNRNYYACDRHKTHKYMGVHYHNEIDDYLPCCYIKDQYAKEGSQLDNYLNGKPPQEIDDTAVSSTFVQQNILTTNKFPSTGFFATLPENLEILLKLARVGANSINDNKEYKYLRRGGGKVFPNMSFLECILLAVKDNGIKKEIDKDVLREECRRLVNLDDRLATSMQENYGKTKYELKAELEKIYRGELYMDPRKWSHLLEEIYQIKIIVFTRLPNESDVSIVLPSYSLQHLSLDTTRYGSIVIVYEHYGGESTQKAGMRRCEVVVNKNVEDESDTYHNYFIREEWESIIEFQTRSLQQYEYNAISRQIRTVDTFRFDKKFKDRISEQYIDSYGKVRALSILVGDKVTGDIKFIRDITFFTSPLPPFDNTIIIKEMNENKENNYNYSYDVFDEVMNSDMFQLDSVSMISRNNANYVIEAHFKVVNVTNMASNTTITLKTEPFIYESMNKNDISIVAQKYPRNTNTSVNQYFDSKRVADIMIEYFIYFYSYYCSVHKIENIDDKNHLSVFMKQSVICKEDPVYKIPTAPFVTIDVLQRFGFLFSLNNESNENNESQQFFVTDCKETRKRLLYSLRHRIKADIDSVKNYHTKVEIDNFYNDPSTYKNDGSIVVTDLSIIRPFDNHVYTTPRFIDEDKSDINNKSEKYFFQHPLLSEFPVLLHLCGSRDMAKIESNYWLVHGRMYNEGDDDKNKNIYDRLFLYETEKQVKVIDSYNRIIINAETFVFRSSQLHFLSVQKL